MPAIMRPAIGRHRPHQQHGRHHVIHLAGELAGVEGQQVERGRGHAGMDVVEMPEADPDHAHHHGQMRQDGRRARRGHADQGLPVDLGLRLIDGNDRLVGEAGKRVEARRSRDWACAGVSCLANRLLQSLRRTGDHVGHQEHQQGHAGERQPAGREVRLQQRPADHHRVQQQAHQEERARRRTATRSLPESSPAFCFDSP